MSQNFLSMSKLSTHRRKIVNILVITPAVSKQISELEIDERYVLLLAVIERAKDLDNCARCHQHPVTEKSLPLCPGCRKMMAQKWADNRDKYRQ